MYFINEEHTKIINWEKEEGSFEVFLPIETADGEVEEVEEEDKPSRKKNKSYSCSSCGLVGHTARTCPAKVSNTPKEYAGSDFNGKPKGFDSDTDAAFEIDEAVIMEVNEMLLDGKGTREIAQHYNISVKTANRAVAKAKGIELPA